jgi:phosphoribosyl-ATP pyrophosphohydrolase
VQEFRNRRRRVGAFEIVGSGDTARANKLQIVGNEYQYPTGEELGVPYLDLSRIQTDLFVTNISRVGGESRTRLRELGLALESARTSNLRVPIIMNVPVAKLPDFASLGMKGPSEITLLGNDQYRALQILVRPEEINSIRPRLMELGAEDVGFGDPVKVERGTEKSEVLRVLPFGESQNIEALSPPTYDAEIAEWLSNLELTIADRALNPDEKSRTTKALRLGTEYCVSRFVVEIAELSEAVRRSDDKGVVEEAGQCVYWFLVALRSKGLTLKDVVNTEKYEDVQQVLQELVRSLRESIDSADAQETTGTSSFLSSGVDGAAISIIDQSLRFSTAIRKETRDEAIVQARKSFASLVTLVELAGVTFDAVMEREQSGG